MTSSYLNLTTSTVLDSHGNGTATLKPDGAAQFWAPDFVKVSTSKQVQPFPYAAIYHVSPGVTVGPTSFIDDTFGGNNDTSSIISGTIVQFGESIVCQWTGGTPGDTAVLSVYGMVSDQPIGTEIVPSSPGTHFSQRLSFAADLPTLIDFASNISMASGNDYFFPPNGGQQVVGITYQVSHFQSFRMQVENSSVGTKPYFGVEFLWFADAQGVTQLDSDYFVFSSNGNQQYGVGIIKAPYLELRFHNYDSANGILNFNLYGSQRIEPRTQFRSAQSSDTQQGLGTDNILYNNIISVNASSTFTTSDFNFYNGPVSINVWVSTTPNSAKSIEVDFNALPTGILHDDKMYEMFVPPSTADFKSPVQFNLAFPRRVVRASVTNNDTINNHVHIYAVAQEL